MTSLRRLLPSASALFVFEAAARYLSFTRDAAELNVTQSAVSRMIARLEAHLDTKLFIRTTTGLELSEDGRHLYNAVTGSFQHMEIAIEVGNELAKFLIGHEIGSKPSIVDKTTDANTRMQKLQDDMDSANESDHGRKKGHAYGDCNIDVSIQ